MNARLLFTSFPRRRPGVGLLVLRLAVGVFLVAHAASLARSGDAPSLGTWAFCAQEAASGLLLAVGLLTPVSAFFAAVSCVGNALAAPVGLFGDTLAYVCVAVMATTAALVGPGAYSLDARLFGRREIHIPERPHRPGAATDADS